MNSCADESGLNVTGGTENEEFGRAGVVDPRVAASAFDAGPPASAQWR
jgi:hypothetical protein